MVVSDDVIDDSSPSEFKESSSPSSHPSFRPLNFQYCSLFCEENVYKMAEQFMGYITSKPHRLSPSLSSHLYVVFISSECKQTPIWRQKACTDSNPVLWDYHVVFLAKSIQPSVLTELLSCELSSSDNEKDNRKLVSKIATANHKIGCTASANEKSDKEEKEGKDERKESEEREGRIKSECNSSYIFDLDSTLQFPCEMSEYYNLSICPDIPLRRVHEQRFRVVGADDFINHFASDRSHMSHTGVTHPDWPPIQGTEAGGKINLMTYIAMGKNEKKEMKEGRKENQDTNKTDGKDRKDGKGPENKVIIGQMNEDRYFGRIMTRKEFLDWSIAD